MILLTLSLLYLSHHASTLAPSTPHEHLLCIIPLTHKTVDNAKVLVSVLEDSCDGIRLFTNDASLPSHILKHRVLLVTTTPKTKYWDLRREISYAIWAYIFDRPKEFEQFDYFVKMGAADTIFMPENFRAMVRAKNFNRKSLLSNLPLYMGHTLYNGERPYIYGLGVYVLNRAALDIIGPLVQQLAQGNRGVLGCLDLEYKPEDDFAGFCLDDLGITPADTRDSQGREYFLIFQARDHYERMQSWREDWYWRGKDPKNVGQQCCTDNAVSFGNYNGEMLERCQLILVARRDYTTAALYEIQVQVDG